jgi:hypothetical protein
MTKQLFFAKLEALDLQWRLHQGSEIRTGTQLKCLCPITAVAYALTDRRWPLDKHDEAAATIGLEAGFAQEVTDCSDSSLIDDEYKRDTRLRLLEACHLIEKRTHGDLRRLAPPPAA